VEHAVTSVPGSPSPRYPDILKTAGVEGEVIVSFVVDTLGMADPLSLRVLKSTHQLFADAVVAAVPNMRFFPALVGGRPVKQLVMEPFVFNISDLTTNTSKTAPSRAPLEKPADTKIVTISPVIITGMRNP
jgi:protein TonB